MISELQRILPPTSVTTRLIDRIAYSRDASLYAMTPIAVVRPRSVADVRALFEWCHTYQQHVTFRTAGTSLSGQAVTDGVIVDVGRHFKQWSVEDDGARLRVHPGVIGAHANAYLRPYGRKIGPDPASIMACMIGGIVANNASGMCCGTVQNSYHTVASITYLLTDGTRIDTGDEASCREWSNGPSPIARGIAQLREEIRADEALVARIRRKYRIKNTIGYSLNAFLDEDDPARILGKLMIGSEGTLGFVEEVVFSTVVDAAFKLTSLLRFHSVADACAQVDVLRDAGAAAIELMDAASLRSVGMHDGAALLVEFQATSHEQRDQHRLHAEALTASMPLTVPATWTQDADEQLALWKIRKGLMPTIGAMRPPGSTMINEDIAVPPHHLASLVHDVRTCFEKHGYREAIIFGHAKDGNIHFVVNQQFTTVADVKQYGEFMDDIAAIVVDTYQGSLKAEHGTGRNMTPYVEKEWGSEAYAFMQRLKKLVDPHGILNPGVILDDDVHAHVRNIKKVPVVDAETDRCIECGFCEHVCPSRSLTLTPRQRIVVRRELKSRPHSDELDVVAEDFDYDGVQTCAVDGICATVCPVGIDTGLLVKRLRHEAHGAWVDRAATRAAGSFGVVNTAARLATSVAHFFVPALNGASATSIREHNTSTADVLLFPSCGARWLGSTSTSPNVIDIMRILSERAGLTVAIPEGSSSECCGHLFASKGFSNASHGCERSLHNFLQQHAGPNTLVVTDSSTCATSMVDQPNTIDPIRFLAEHILPRLTITARRGHVVLHPGCGVEKLRLTPLMRTIAEACADHVTIPITASCCGMAGDRGILHPELPESALAQERAEVLTMASNGYYAANTTCEIALSRAMGVHYEPIAALLEACSRPTSERPDPSM